MSREKNLQVVENVVAAYNARDWNLVEELHSKSVIGWSPEVPEPRKGRKAIRKEFVDYALAFPDSRILAERIFGEKDWVFGEFMFSGTHKGPLPGPSGQMIPATNRPLRLQYAIAFKLKGGKITERHEYFDLLGMLTQLGLTH